MGGCERDAGFEINGGPVARGPNLPKMPSDHQTTHVRWSGGPLEIDETLTNALRFIS